MNKAKKALCTMMTFYVMLFVWFLASRTANPLFIPSPASVFDNFVILIKDGSLFVHFLYTFKRIMISSVLSGATALVIGLLIYNSKIARVTVYPLVSLFRYVPVTAFYPLLIMWVGIGESMKISFLFIACFVYMLPTVVLSLDEINEQLIETGKTIGMNRLQLIRLVQLPATLPSLLNSFVMMIGIGWTYCAVVETINARYGLGYVIHQGSARGNTALVFMAIITIMACSFIIDNTAKWLIRHVFKWRYVNDRD